MATPLVCDERWAIIAPLLPGVPPTPTGGQPRIPDRAYLTGMLWAVAAV